MKEREGDLDLTGGVCHFSEKHNTVGDTCNKSTLNSQLGPITLANSLSHEPHSASYHDSPLGPELGLN